MNTLFADIITYGKSLLPLVNTGIRDSTQFNLSVSCTLQNIGRAKLSLRLTVYTIWNKIPLYSFP